jgi:hypothetical protein
MVKSAEFLKMYELTVRVKQPTGNTMQIKTTVQASSALLAKKLAEAQYGKGSVMSTPREIK